MRNFARSREGHLHARRRTLAGHPERFEHLERGRNGGHDGPVERYGKKYQWIGSTRYSAASPTTTSFEERWSESETVRLRVRRTSWSIETSTRLF